MKEHPILFSAPMVLAILEGRKTQTRRAMRLQPSTSSFTVRLDKKWGTVAEWPGESEFDYYDCHCPFGTTGDRLWVREAWKPVGVSYKQWVGVFYKSDGTSRDCPYFSVNLARQGWRPGIHMPRVAARITLEVTGVRVERLQEISHRDALAEGVEYDVSKADGSPLARYEKLWNSINGWRAWSKNPWVWVVEFKGI